MKRHTISFLFLLALAVVFGGYNLGRALLGPKQGEDFAQYYLAGRAILDGEASRMYDAGPAYEQRAARHGVKGVPIDGEIRSVMTFAYPPFAGVAAIPLALLPYRAARLIFFLLSLAASLLAMPLLFANREGKWKREMITVGLLATMIFFPTHYSLYMGQINSILLLCCAGALELLRRDRPLAAGGCIAIASTIKIFPLVLLIPLLLRRKFRAAAGTIAGVLILAALAAALCGFEPWKLFLTEVLPAQYAGGAWYRNQGYFGFLARLLTENDFVDSFGHFPTFVRAASALLGVATIGAAAALASRARRGGAVSLDLTFALFLTAALLALSKSWEHYAIFLLPSYLFLYERARTSSSTTSTLLLALLLSFCTWSFALNTGTEYDSLPRHRLANILFSAKFFATMLLFACNALVLGKLAEGGSGAKGDGMRQSAGRSTGGGMKCSGTG